MNNKSSLLRRMMITVTMVIPVILVGCGNAAQVSNQANSTITSKPTSNTTGGMSHHAPGNQTAVIGNETGNSSTTNQTGAQSQLNSTETAYGWRYVDLPTTFSSNAQIDGLQQGAGHRVKVLTSAQQTSGGAIKLVYKSAPLDTTDWQFTGQPTKAQRPKDYQGEWSLKFGKLNGHKPVSVTILDNGQAAFILPASIPGYASEINPQTGNPGGYDNRLLGQSGDWLWLAMKGPGNPPWSEMVWRYRYWNRIVAVNTKTWQTRVYAIPRSTSRVSTWGTTPAFTVQGGQVYIGTGAWLGVFPANPTATTSIPVVQPEPASVVKSDQQAMLKALTGLETTAAQSLVTFWNDYVMKGNQKAQWSSWIMDPVWYNHGDFPGDLMWAVNFPLQPGDKAYAQRQAVLSKIETMLSNPLPQTWVAYPEPKQMRQHFHSTPPGPVPGYTIQGGYYVKK